MAGSSEHRELKAERLVEFLKANQGAHAHAKIQSAGHEKVLVIEADEIKVDAPEAANLKRNAELFNELAAHSAAFSGGKLKITYTLLHSADVQAEPNKNVDEQATAEKILTVADVRAELDKISMAVIKRTHPKLAEAYDTLKEIEEAIGKFEKAASLSAKGAKQDQNTLSKNILEKYDDRHFKDYFKKEVPNQFQIYQLINALYTRKEKINGAVQDEKHAQENKTSLAVIDLLLEMFRDYMIEEGDNRVNAKNFHDTLQKWLLNVIHSCMHAYADEQAKQGVNIALTDYAKANHTLAKLFNILLNNHAVKFLPTVTVIADFIKKSKDVISGPAWFDRSTSPAKATPNHSAGPPTSQVPVSQRRL